MGRERSDLSNQKVLDTWLECGSIYKASKVLDCSEVLVKLTILGRRREPQPPKSKIFIPKEKICVSCGYRPVWEEEGCSLLCELCFKYKGRGITIYG